MIAFLALMLAAQAALLLWISQSHCRLDAGPRSPRRLAVLVASDIGAALAADPALDLETIRAASSTGHVLQTFLVIMRDGRVASEPR